MGYGKGTTSESTYVVRFPAYQDKHNFSEKLCALRQACRDAKTMDELIRVSHNLNRYIR